MDTKSGDGGEQEVDLDDADVSAIAEPPRATAPPPLPPEVVAARTSAGPPPAGSLASAAPESGRGPLFYVGLLVAFLVVGLVAGAAVMLTRRPPPDAVQAPTATAAPAVITIPTVHMDDDPDSGP